MSLAEFQGKLFPERSVFERRQFDFHTNLVKWVAIRVAYVLARLKISANLLDVASLLLATIGFLFLLTSLEGNRVLPLIGILFIFFHVFVDFVDGAIAKAANASSQIGYLLDKLGCDYARLAMIVVLGVFSGKQALIVANLFSAAIFVLFSPYALPELPASGVYRILGAFYGHKFSLFSVRFVLGLLPLLMGIAILLGIDLIPISKVLSLFYLVSAVFLLLICIPHHDRGTP